MLMIPTPPAASVQDIIDKLTAYDKSDWMLLDKGMITMDGRECDKVGTSFNAFRFQSDSCNR